MDDPKQHIIDSLKQANNILVTVRNSPSIDQLAACIALTLVLNELDKHGTAVFSGEVPSVLEFLEPGKTLERNTDSLQDFIISLDKSKADKLRYKVEDSVVRIFITPYRTSISEKDLEFGQGDFNVDVVVALGVHNQEDLDQAITAHGRILHDATVISINIEPGGSEDLGSINWINTDASSLSEMVAGLVPDLGKENVIDNQVATALLTGIVAETERFGNAKTTPETMNTAAKLLTAGANQELVATKLAEPAKAAVAAEPAARPTEAVEEKHDDHQDDGGTPSGVEPAPDKPNDGGTLEINHPGVAATADNDKPAAADKAASETDLAHSPQPFAHEGDSFEVAQPQDLTAVLQAVGATAEPAAGAEGVPPVYLPGQDPPDRQAGQPSFNQPPSGQSSSGTDQVANDESEERAALDLINQRKVQLENRAIIQPLRDQGQFLASPTKVILDDPPTKQEADKFALAPPTTGGNLNSTVNHGDSGDRRIVENKDAAPLMKHDTIAPAPVPAAAAQPEAPAASEPAQVAVPAPAAEAKPAAAAAPAATPLIEPLPTLPPIIIPEVKPVAVTPPQLPALPVATNEPLITPAINMAAPPKPPTIEANETLADIERRMHSPHLAPTSGPVTAAPSAPVADAPDEHAHLQPMLTPQPGQSMDTPKPAEATPQTAKIEEVDTSHLMTPLSPPPISPPPIAAPVA